MIGQNPKAEVAPFSSADIGIKNLVFRTEVTMNGRANLMPNSGRRSRAEFLVVGVTRCVDTVAKTPGEEAK